LHLSWSVHQPRASTASTASTAGGHTVRKASLTDVSFKKLADIASPPLQHCAMGKTIPKAKLKSRAPTATASRTATTPSNWKTSWPAA
jgi:type VI secretion system secreted protein Hcp